MRLTVEVGEDRWDLRDAMHDAELQNKMSPASPTQRRLRPSSVGQSADHAAKEGDVASLESRGMMQECRDEVRSSSPATGQA